MRCLYCYNKNIVLGKGQISEEEFLKFLDKRVGKLSGVVFSGGECTLNPSFLKLAREVKKRNFKLKVDTNGTNSSILRKAISEKLIDYVALDFKSVKQKYKNITGSNLYEKFIETLRFLIKINFNFEVRTSVHADLLDENDITQMAKILEQNGYKGVYFLQGFLQTDDNFGNLKTATKEFNPNLIQTTLKIELRNF